MRKILNEEREDGHVEYLQSVHYMLGIHRALTILAFEIVDHYLAGTMWSLFYTFSTYSHIHSFNFLFHYLTQGVHYSLSNPPLFYIFSLSPARALRDNYSNLLLFSSGL